MLEAALAHMASGIPTITSKDASADDCTYSYPSERHGGRLTVAQIPRRPDEALRSCVAGILEEDMA